MKAIVRTAAAGRSRLGNAQVASPTLAAQSAPLLARESTSEPSAPTGLKAEGRARPDLGEISQPIG